jgi:hypothetical protein
MDAKTREYIMSTRSHRFHMFIKHKETNHLHRMDMEFSNSTEREKFIEDLPEVLEFIHCEKI